jgi:NAD(P)-dependent dehydrogenase (short-subunit alcohol dehydrogenase family)
MALARRGIAPVLAVRDVDAALKVREAVNALGVPCKVQQCDVSNAKQVQELIDMTVRAWGRIDVLINNAGQIAPIGHLADTSIAEWTGAITTNLIGPYHLLHAALPELQARRGVVVNLSTGAAHTPREGWSAYCTSKAGLAMLTRCVAHEYGPKGVAAYSLQPGVVDTGMQAQIRNSGMNEISRIPKEKLAHPEYAANMVAWLADARPEDLMGQELNVSDEALAERSK